MSRGACCWHDNEKTGCTDRECRVLDWERACTHRKCPAYRCLDEATCLYCGGPAGEVPWAFMWGSIVGLTCSAECAEGVFHREP